MNQAPHFSLPFFINFSIFVGSIGEIGADYIRHNIWMQQLPGSVLVVCSDIGHFLVEVQKLAELFEAPMLWCIDRRDGYFHLRRLQRSPRSNHIVIFINIRDV